MKITRKRSGYVVRCSDSEFAALQQLAAIDDLKAARKRLSGNAKNGFTRRVRGGDFFRIDVDNRDRVFNSPSKYSR